MSLIIGQVFVSLWTIEIPLNKCHDASSPRSCHPTKSVAAVFQDLMYVTPVRAGRPYGMSIYVFVLAPEPKKIMYDDLPSPFQSVYAWSHTAGIPTELSVVCSQPLTILSTTLDNPSLNNVVRWVSLATTASPLAMTAIKRETSKGRKDDHPSRSSLGTP